MKPVVLQLIDSFHQGGSERQALQLTRLLIDSGRYEVRLACLNPEGVLRAEIQDLPLGDIPAFPLTAFYNANAVQQTKRFVHYLRSNEVQLLHAHDFYTNVFGMFGGSLARVPVKIASMRETHGMRTEGQRRLQQMAYKAAHHVVANSGSVKQELMRQGVPEHKISVVYNGIDAGRVLVPASRSRAESLASLGLKPNGDSRYVTLVANMRHEVKDYPMFLRAAKRVRNEIENAEFLLAGEGELMPELKLMAHDLGLADSAHFLGRCEAIAELLHASDVCVLTSKAEGFSNSILEYMAAGRPVIATDVGGASEAITEGRTGYLVPAGNDELMAARIIAVLKSSDISTMGNTGRQIVAEKFSLEAQLARTEELYERLISGTGVSPV
ncbi:MAG TPA: glycosyltransferase [Pyrinomonadaceae bacterium]|nr:glycosyltransferase [Pyrinomonadaceae bacterium]